MPLNVYGNSKLQGELNIINVDCEFYIIRVSWLMSKHNNNFIKSIISKLKKGDELKIIKDQIGVPTSTSLVVDMTKQLIAQRKRISKEIFHVTPKGAISWYELVLYIANKMLLSGIKINKDQIKPITSVEFNSLATRPSNSCLSHKKIEKILNISMPSWEKDIDEIINFHIKN